jgi:hypothetical protein
VSGGEGVILAVAASGADCEEAELKFCSAANETRVWIGTS